jgi:dTDP-4-amino-4,6-dideoxygalactose transaminase
MSPQIPFIDLAAQQERIRPQIDAAIAKVLAHGRYILGPEVGELEKKLADFVGVRHAIGCASGTDALLLPMLADGIGADDVVFVPAFTFVAAAEVSAILGATPFFVDVSEDDFNISADSLKQAISDVTKAGLNPRAIVPVDLYGQLADYPALQAIADENGLMIIEDAAQSFGATLQGKTAGAFGDVAGTSFFPAKPLGCYGDGGAIFTNDDALAQKILSARVHGQGKGKYQYDNLGLNGRLDTLQAAILIEKLAIFPDEMAARERVAGRYTQALKDIVIVPEVLPGRTSVWAQYTIRVDDRDNTAKEMADKGIPTAIHYPKPLSQQPAYANYPVVSTGIETSERLAQHVLSLPMHPYLTEEHQHQVITTLHDIMAAH